MQVHTWSCAGRLGWKRHANTWWWQRQWWAGVFAWTAWSANTAGKKHTTWHTQHTLALSSSSASSSSSPRPRAASIASFVIEGCLVAYNSHDGPGPLFFSLPRSFFFEFFDALFLLYFISLYFSMAHRAASEGKREKRMKRQEEKDRKGQKRKGKKRKEKKRENKKERGE